MKNKLTKLLHNNRMMTLLSAIFPVISLLIFNSNTGLQLACLYMYIIAPFIMLRILGHKFKKVEQPRYPKKKGKASKAPEFFLLNGKQYSLWKLNSLMVRNFFVVLMSLFTIMFFNDLHLPVAGQLVLAGPYLLIHGFFFFTGEPLSLLKSFVPLISLNMNIEKPLHDNNRSRLFTENLPETHPRTNAYYHYYSNTFSNLKQNLSTFHTK